LVLTPDEILLVVPGAALFGAVTGAVAILGHIAADALRRWESSHSATTGRISPTTCVGPTVRSGRNYGLLALGISVAVGSFCLARGVNAVAAQAIAESTEDLSVSHVSHSI